MTDTSLSTRKRLIAIGVASVLFVVSVFGVIAYNFTVSQQQAAGSVEQWFGIGFERRQLEDAHSEKVISDEDYQSEKKRLIASEDQIARIFPRNMTEFKAYDEADEKDARRPVEFWIALFTSIVTALATASGVVIAWKSDRRIAMETELKLIKLKNELSPPEESRIIRP